MSLQAPYGIESSASSSIRLQPSPLPLQPDEQSYPAQSHALDAPSTEPRRASPMKSQRRVSAPDPGGERGRMGFVPITAPPSQVFTTDSPTKRPPFFPPTYSSALFTTFSSLTPDKLLPNENTVSNQPLNENVPDTSELSRTPEVSTKRPLTEEAPSKARPTKKKKANEDSVPVQVPEPHEMPPIKDDGTKPPYSYATLIGMAILRAPHRRMTLSQIYKWIGDTFSFYGNSESGWQNSIRHNLSLHKLFVKQERPKEDPGKGNYWAIEPGKEGQFLNVQPLRQAAMSKFPLPSIPHKNISSHSQNGTEAAWVVSQMPSKQAPSPHSPSPENGDSPKLELSSDATLPASDPALQEEQEKKEKDGEDEDEDEEDEEEEEEEEEEQEEQDTGDENANALAFQAPPRSSPPRPLLQTIQSSPPVAPQFIREGTPPTPSRKAVPSSAAKGPGKQKQGTMNDSGYFSSLESSAMRPNKDGDMFSDFEIEPPCLKRGRAEEEIARIRSSSQDTSPGRSGIVKEAGIGSSPSRGGYVRMLPPPLTPVVKFKKPAKPPPSLSPNTNLQNHRKKIQHMVNSPIKHLGLADEDLPYSPAFNIQEEFIPNENANASFDVFTDSALEENVSTPVRGSAGKPSAKRRLISGGIGDNVLTDVTSMNVNSKSKLSPFSNRAKSLLGSLPDSPSKPPDGGRFADATIPDEFFSFI